MADATANQTNTTETQPESTPLISDAAASAETEEEQVSRISGAIARAKAALEEVKAKVAAYDEQYKASETASGYLLPPIQKAQAAFDELSATAATLKDKTVEFPTKALSRTLSAASGALEQVTEMSRKYDEKFQLSSTVQKAVSVPKEKCHSALVEASNLAASVSASANATLQGVNHGIVSRAASVASASASIIFNTAAALEDRFDIESKAVDAGTKVASKAGEVDEKYQVREKLDSFASASFERAMGLDSKVTGGKVTPLVLDAYEKGLALATGGLDFVKTGYQSAKEQRHSVSEAGAQGEQKTEESAGDDAAEAPVAPEEESAGDDAAEAPVAPEEKK